MVSELTSLAERRLYLPLIVCEGKCKGPTRHTYVERRPINESARLAAFRAIFACVDCGKERVYG